MNTVACDQTLELQQFIKDALAAKTTLAICGGGSKAFLGRETTGTPLCLKAHTGIVNYHPSELVITARAGTLLSEIKSVLAKQRQMLAFEPPSFADSATLGGTVACGLSGPSRPFTGSARDFVLGCRIINGKAEILAFGGEVIKNVAGYDISRLMVGAMGTLGVLLEISLKVLPMPLAESTCCFELPVASAIGRMSELAASSLPVSGLSYDGRILYARLSGSEQAVNAAVNKIGGDFLAADIHYWHQLNEQQHAFFQSKQNLWRLCLPPATQPLELSGQCFYDWGGGLRWLKSDETPHRVFSALAHSQGHAILYKSKNRKNEVFQPLSGKLKQLNANIKKAFDPEGLFNPNRMHKDW